MRPEDLKDFFTLRRLASNPLEIVRFRKKQREGQALQVRLLDGRPLYIRGGRADFHMFHRIFLRDEYRIASYSPGTWECIVDLGANVGIFAVRASFLAKKVVAFEPFPQNFAHLQKNVEKRANILPVCKAVSEEIGALQLHLPKDDASSGAYSVFVEAGGRLSDEFDEVPATTLDAIFSEHEITVCDLLKMDVEGKEYDVLHAASEDTLARIRRIHGEYHNVRPEETRTRIENFSGFLQSKGYEVDVVPHGRKANHGMFYAARTGLS